MENKIDWSKIDKIELAKKIAESWVKRENDKHERFWHYHLYTPFWLKIWHKITFKKTPKL